MRVWQACALALVLVLLLVDASEARRRKDKKRGGSRSRGKTGTCKYRRPTIGECNTVTNMKEVTLKLKASRSGTDCEPTQVHMYPCDDNTFEKKIMKRRRRKKKQKSMCKYERKRTKGECDPTTQKVEVTRALKPNQPTTCAPTKTKLKRCGKKKDRRQKKGCVYDKQPWSECNATTLTRERVLVRVAGDESKCNPNKLVSKPCKTVCRFDKGEWSECAANATHSHRTLTPKAGSPPQCKLFTQAKTCARMEEMAATQGSKCRYKAGSWGGCDTRSNTETKVWTLKNGDPNHCMATKTQARKCKSSCRFRRGEWSECDEKTGLTTRVDTLFKGSRQHCDPTRTITHKCKDACKYDWAEWSPCSESTNQRSRIGVLVKGDRKKCSETNFSFRPCTNRNGEERCFFGSWGEFGACQNGVMTKHRTVLQGGVECERRAAMNQACPPDAS